MRRARVFALHGAAKWAGGLAARYERPERIQLAEASGNPSKLAVVYLILLGVSFVVVAMLKLDNRLTFEQIRNYIFALNLVPPLYYLQTAFGNRVEKYLLRPVRFLMIVALVALYFQLVMFTRVYILANDIKAPTVVTFIIVTVVYLWAAPKIFRELSKLMAILFVREFDRPPYYRQIEIMPWGYQVYVRPQSHKMTEGALGHGGGLLIYQEQLLIAEGVRALQSQLGRGIDILPLNQLSHEARKNASALLLYHYLIRALSQHYDRPLEQIAAVVMQFRKPYLHIYDLSRIESSKELGRLIDRVDKTK